MPEFDDAGLEPRRGGHWYKNRASLAHKQTAKNMILLSKWGVIGNRDIRYVR